jgi:hypothetical protein
VNEAVCDALFASPLQPGDSLTAETIAQAIGSTVRRYSAAGCTRRVAEEFSEHPEESAGRMHWVGELASAWCGCLYFPTAVAPTTASAGAGLLPVRQAA